jgi:hypothetical protein
MTKEQIKRYYRLFCRWQQAEPHYVNRHQDSVLNCHNCGTEFADNFCPRCGQRAEVGRVGWNSVKESVALLWGMDSRSLTYTLVQLLGRPGYLVRDYISGRRLVSFPPVKMLVIVCLFVVIFETVFHLHKDVVVLMFNNQAVSKIIEWVNSQKSWATLLVNSLYILPTWLVFRFAPGYPRPTLPGGFFLQVFLSVQSLLLGFVGYWNTTAETVLVTIFMYMTYRQLFGYRWWGTLWRFAVVELSQMAAVVTFVTIVLLFLYDANDREVMIKAFLIILSTVALLTAIALYVTHLNNKRTFYQESKEINSNTDTQRVEKKSK